MISPMSYVNIEIKILTVKMESIWLKCLSLVLFTHQGYASYKTFDKIGIIGHFKAIIRQYFTLKWWQISDFIIKLM